MRQKKGFTIIELMLAMTFVAILMITIAFLVIRITAIYQKGLSIRTINQVGRNLMSDFSRTVAASPVDDTAVRNQYFYANMDGTTQQNGAFCTGKYSYLWNTGTAINQNTRIQFQNLTGTYNFRLLRMEDTARMICQKLSGLSGSTLDLSASDQIKDAVPIELLSISGVETAATTENAAESDLAIYDLRVFQPTINQITGHAFYSATFILGTLRGIDINASGDYCSNVSSTLSTDFSYCSLNKFNFAMTTSGDTGGKHDDVGSRTR
jgi:type II secretory pathway pseudopilin PulG